MCCLDIFARELNGSWYHVSVNVCEKRNIVQTNSEMFMAGSIDIVDKSVHKL